MHEEHADEQYFFDADTLDTLADFLDGFSDPCLLCAPMLGRRLHERGRDVRVLDIDTRFADLPGFAEWTIYRPEHRDERFDLILCDPPFFNVSLSQLFDAIRMLSHFDLTQRVMISCLSRRSNAILGTFAPFGLEATAYKPGYQTVKQVERNEIEFFANFDTGLSPEGAAK